MFEKYLNKYRISSARLQHWNYGNNAAYFITICAKNFEHFFGEISNGEMHLNNIGKIVENEWIKTPDIRPDMNLELGVFVVMPNMCSIVETPCMASLHPRYKNKFGQQSKNLSSIIRGFKSSVTKQVKKWIETQCIASLRYANFEWQARFHDHIIRDAESFIRIQNYIVNNPLNWKEDKFNKPGI
jgi:putative transposase